MYSSNKVAFAIMRAVISIVLKLSNLKVDIRNFSEELKGGDIFLFNHFIRAETALPQYLLYCADTKIRSFAIAHSSFFKVWWLGPILRKVGAVPHNHPDLMELLIGKLSEGYKVVVFPQGKMVKNQEAVEMRTGAAVLALGTGIYKRHIKDNPEDYSVALLEFANKPTKIVTCNISYYPMRVSPNMLTRLGEKNKLPEALVEELTVEGNMFIHDTTMTLNYGEAFIIDSTRISTEGVTDIKSSLAALLDSRGERFIVRDEYSRRIYSSLLLNLGHVFSEVLFQLSGAKTVSCFRVRNSVELSCAKLDVPFSEEEYRSLVEVAIFCGLIREAEFKFEILEKLTADQPFQLARRENPISVYRSELSSMVKGVSIIKSVVDDSWDVSKRGFVLRTDKESRGSVVILHGLYATADQCRRIAEKVRADGYDVFVPLLAGHGTSAEDLSTKTHDDWYTSVSNRLPSGSFHIIGFSTGGLLAARVAKEFGDRVLSLSCICAPQKFVHSGMSFARVLKKIRFPKYWDNGRNPETYDRIPVSSICELQDLVKLSKDYFSDLTVPTVVTQTAKDPIVDPISGEDIIKLLPKGNANLSVIDSNKHDIDSSEESVLEFIGENT